MDRKKRIRIVLATVMGVISLFVATVGAELASAGYVWMFSASSQGSQLEAGD